MGTILYIFPHPDDESFGPAAVLHQQSRLGHEVHLLTLTRGGATKKRHELGLSIDEMGRMREREMRGVERELRLASLTVLDLPDGDLKEVDPIEIEAAIRLEVERLRPEVLVTYAAHGISGFEDHLVSHAVVKRVFCELRDFSGAPRRLALSTLASIPPGERPFRLSASKSEEIDVVIEAEPIDLEAQRRALDCYVTYRDVIARVDPMSVNGDRFVFEIFQERHEPPLSDLFERLPKK